MSDPLQHWRQQSESLLRHTVLENPYIPVTPHAKQAVFLADLGLETLFGGAAGPGKSVALLMSALQFVDVPGYAALLLRRRFVDLMLPGALIPMSIGWLGGTRAEWHGDRHAWTFPSGATIRFGYLETKLDVFQYQSAQFSFIGWDELSQFRESEYRYLFSRLRRPKDLNVPLRMRSASNPGGTGHQWVKQRFLVDGQREGRTFVRATLADNPHIDRESYEQSLSHLDPITRRQLLDGDWTARPEGGLFRREWFKLTEVVPDGLQNWVRFWDLAATVADETNDPDWTCGVLMGERGGVAFIRHVLRFRGTPKENEDRIRSTAAADGRTVRIRMEQEPGASGKSLVDHYARNVLFGYDFVGVSPRKNKLSRAGALSSAVEGGRVSVKSAPWNSDFFDELEAFRGEDEKNDQVDAATGAFNDLAENTGQAAAGHSSERYEDLPRYGRRPGQMVAM